MLSGFVMVHSQAERLGPRFTVLGSLSYWWARFARVWPAWALLTTLMVGWLRLVGWHVPWSTEQLPDLSVAGWLEQLTLTQMWHREYSFDSSYLVPGWSLSVEVAAYAAFPLLVPVLWRLRRLPATALAVASVVAVAPLAALCWSTGSSSSSLPWTLRIAGGFLAGALAALAVRRSPAGSGARRRAPLVATAALLGLVFLACWPAGQESTVGGDRTGISVLLLPPLVAALAAREAGPARLLASRSWVHGGRMSFSLYLVHWLFLDAVYWVAAEVPALAPGSTGLAVVQVLLLPLSLLAGHLVWRLVEEPSRHALMARDPFRRTCRPAVPVDGGPPTRSLRGLPVPPPPVTVLIPQQRAADRGRALHGRVVDSS